MKAIDGVKSVERIVCGGCLDFKVITSLEEAKFGAWAETEFAPESDFLKALEGIDGVSVIETQTFTVRSSILVLVFQIQQFITCFLIEICNHTTFLLPSPSFP